jgi:hypothetical protein
MSSANTLSDADNMQATFREVFFVGRVAHDLLCRRPTEIYTSEVELPLFLVTAELKVSEIEHPVILQNEELNLSGRAIAKIGKSISSFGSRCGGMDKFQNYAMRAPTRRLRRRQFHLVRMISFRDCMMT